jgi:hypothetical protein
LLPHEHLTHAVVVGLRSLLRADLRVLEPVAQVAVAQTIRRKPDDIGNGYSCASLLPTGHWLALVRGHHTHGIVELTGALELDEGWRRHPDAVRRYRAARMSRSPWNFGGALVPRSACLIKAVHCDRGSRLRAGSRGAADGSARGCCWLVGRFRGYVAAARVAQAMWAVPRGGLIAPPDDPIGTAHAGTAESLNTASQSSRTTSSDSARLVRLKG